MINIAIIGYGYWGPNLMRNFNSNPNCHVSYLVDSRVERLDLAKKTYPNLQISQHFDEVIASNEVDAVVIATPVYTHFELAKKALERGKHVLLEKPMTANVAEAEELIRIAKDQGLTLMVDHTFLYTNSIQKIKSLVQNGDLGQLQYFDSTRINLGLIQQDVNVLWDLAPHDISILSYLVDKKPISVQAVGVSHIHNGIENIAYMNVNYEEKFMAHFHCSWSSPVKVRNIMIGGDKKMVVYNDNEPTEKIKIYDSGYSVQNDEDKRRVLIDYRIGDIYVPKIENNEALGAMVKDFLDSIDHKTTPISSFESGLTCIKILEASQKSIKNKGIEIEI